ncbi:MAG: signal peptidase II [Candidatus Glassbacteria bacterium]|nr:signal peptidase II [Candidatus Glassbacteria bacterium]
MPDKQASSSGVTLKLRLWLFFTIVPAVLFTDLFTKLIVRRTMTAYGETVPVVQGLVKLRFIYNEGIVFGLKLGLPSKWILVLVTFSVAFFLIGYIFFSGYEDRPGLVSLNLIIGGALGNLHDRILYGRVVDFIECGIGELTWPVFNVADIAVTCGALLLAVRLLFYSEKTGDKNGPAPRDLPPDRKAPTDS